MLGRGVVAALVAAWLITGTDARAPLRDHCAREVVAEFPFIRWTHPPTARPFTTIEIQARTALAICRYLRSDPELAAEWAAAREGAGNDDAS